MFINELNFEKNATFSNVARPSRLQTVTQSNSDDQLD